MKAKIIFYGLVIGLTVADAFLISNPNLLGKLGFIIYKYSYLRTFPRALVTVSLVVGAVSLIMEALVSLAKSPAFRKTVKTLMVILIVLFIGVLIKTALDFQSWAFSHTGHKLRYGAYLLPGILILIAARGYVRVVQLKWAGAEVSKP